MWNYYQIPYFRYLLMMNRLIDVDAIDVQKRHFPQVQAPTACLLAHFNLCGTPVDAYSLSVLPEAILGGSISLGRSHLRPYCAQNPISNATTTATAPPLRLRLHSDYVYDCTTITTTTGFPIRLRLYAYFDYDFYCDPICNSNVSSIAHVMRRIRPDRLGLMLIVNGAGREDFNG
jgi:hypothetical protein